MLYVYEELYTTCCETRRISIFKMAVRQSVIRRIIPQIEFFIYLPIYLPQYIKIRC